MKFIETNEWCLSADGEFFSLDGLTYEEAIEACRENDEGYIGRAVKVEFDESDFNCEIGYEYGETLFDKVGDVAESWELSEEHEIELNERIGKLIADYLTEHGLQSTCCKVVDIQEVESE